MYFIHTVLHRRDLESKKWIFTNFVVGGEMLHVCVLMSLGVGMIGEERIAQKVLSFKTLGPALAQEGGAVCRTGSEELFFKQ